ncbi:MAG: hypothetical protein V8S27_04730 [Lachnospiraceae bacterium]
MYRILYVTSEKKINEMMLEYAKSLEIEMVDEVVVPRLENYEVDEEVAEQKISQLDMKLYDAVICRGGMGKSSSGVPKSSDSNSDHSGSVSRGNDVQYDGGCEE